LDGLRSPGVLLHSNNTMMHRWQRISQTWKPDSALSCDGRRAVVVESAVDDSAFWDTASSCAIFVRWGSGIRKETTEVDRAKPLSVKMRLRNGKHGDRVGTRDSTQQQLHPKTRLHARMRDLGAVPGWFCNRCLNWAALGTYENCQLVCPSGYKTIMCEKDDRKGNKRRQIDIDVQIRGELLLGGENRAIPRIIHQTWFEEITYDRYPQLMRMQASWKNSGWDFRFYTDDSARQFIVDNYPSLFVDAFDALIHGAYKADLFRYLVLLKEGGIYADVDVMLESSLDAFITPTLSFFAPRDIPCEYAGEAYCLYVF
jgi:Glycosyltransferase sugar-binding region containing DXD motif